MDIHLRIKISNLLNEQKSFKAIGRAIGKDCTTISKEIKKHLIQRDDSGYGRIFNNCINRYDCKLYNVCSVCQIKKSRLCRSCKFCRSECDVFIEEVCEKLFKPPYVCNGCQDKNKCTLTKSLYEPFPANKNYEAILSESRSGLCITDGDIDRLNSVLEPLLKKGQSIHHIYINHGDELMVSEKTLYKIIDSGVLKVRNIDLPRQVRRRPRRKSSTTYKVDKKCLNGRRYEDFQAFMDKYPDTAVVEIDTVEGLKGESCVLTIHFKVFSFMIAVKREFNDSKSVTDYFNYLYDELGHDCFKKLFPVILADNGSEFSNPNAIEFNKNGERRTYIFYCHPASPHEKGSCEVNHQFIRRIVPKRKSFNPYTQKDINKMMSHINSYARSKLNDKSPYLLFSIIHGEKLLNLLSITHIDSDDINLTPSLLSK